MFSRTQVDRYPAKMVSRLADRLVERYASNATRILDPFCGSGAVLVAASRMGIPVTGVDVNPIAALFSLVKLKGFDPHKAIDLANDLVHSARHTAQPLPIEWSGKHYWFTPATLDKLERVRGAAKEMGLRRSNAGMAVLMSFTLSIRLCSKADQRSPKPFISKDAKKTRRGLHFDPYVIMLMVLEDLAQTMPRAAHHHASRFVLSDVTSSSFALGSLVKHSHVITSPPYINAQDYFRNFKLELYTLEGLLPFRVEDIRTRFIGTERGVSSVPLAEVVVAKHRCVVPGLEAMEASHPRQAAVVHRYFADMASAFDNVIKLLSQNCRIVLICG